MDVVNLGVGVAPVWAPSRHFFAESPSGFQVTLPFTKPPFRVFRFFQFLL
jgi:hypothetical protein